MRIVALWLTSALVIVLAADRCSSADDLFSGDPFAESSAEQPAIDSRVQPELEGGRHGPDTGAMHPAAEAPPGAESSQQVPPVVCLTLRLPITGTRDTQFASAVTRQLPLLRSQPARRGLLVVRFDASSEDAAAPSDFGRSLELARFLSDRRLDGVKTVAWIPESLRGHGVLPALACEEIVMHPEAALGPVEEDASAVDDAMRAAYEEIASRRQAVPPTVAVALLDPSARVVRAITADGEAFVPQSEVESLRDRVAVRQVEELGPPPLVLPARRARELGFVQRLAEGEAALAVELSLPPESLTADPSLEGGWRAVQIPLTGPIDPARVARARARLAEAVAAGANFICLRIDSPGGSLEQSLVMATALARLDPSAVRTVAWIPREALGDAALVAAACDEIVMAPLAVIGGEGAGILDPRAAESLKVAWREAVAKPRGRSWSLPLALVAPGIVVHRMTEPRSRRVAFFCDEELAARADRDAWTRGPRVGVGPIRVTGNTAESLGLSTHVVETAAGVSAAYGLEGPMVIVEPSWVDRLFDALAQPGVAWLLLLIGGAGLYIELHTPGVGLGGFVAMVAFIVYFWSQYLQGTAGWLEVMLFLAGLFCLAAEIFVLPGFGVLGLGGGLLVVASLVLASQSFIMPANDYQIRQLQHSLTGILAATTGIVAMSVFIRRWLPNTPVIRNVLLSPPVPPSSTDEAGDADVDSLEGLLGEQGVTTTRLAPAGKAAINGRIRDVCVEGDLIEPGRRVRVTEIRGSRVFVRETTTSRDLVSE